MASRWGASSWTASSTWESDHLVRLSLRVCASLSYLPVVSSFSYLCPPFFPPSFSSSVLSLFFFISSFLLVFHLITLSVGVSVFSSVSAMFIVYSTSMLSVYSHTQGLCGDLYINCAVCAPSNTLTTTHAYCTYMLIPPSPTQKPEQVWSI